MIAPHEASLIVRIVVKHSIPNRRMPFLTARAVRLERNKGLRVMVCYYLQIVARQIGFVRAHLRHCEVAARSLYESGELRRVASVTVCDLDRCYHVGFDAAH